MSIGGMARSNSASAMDGLRRAASMEEQREFAGDTLRQQYDTNVKSGIMSGVGTGATLGFSVGGPWGALIGGVVGGLAGYGVSA
jgi:uncharacterized membrane protein